MSYSKKPPPANANMQIVNGEVHKIPRPMNAFMLFGHENRKLLQREYPELSNKDISKKLGDCWQTLPKEIKSRFYAQAKEVEKQHKLQFPNYQYSPGSARLRKRAAQVMEQLGQPIGPYHSPGPRLKHGRYGNMSCAPQPHMGPPPFYVPDIPMYGRPQCCCSMNHPMSRMPHGMLSMPPGMFSPHMQPPYMPPPLHHRPLPQACTEYQTQQPSFQDIPKRDAAPITKTHDRDLSMGTPPVDILEQATNESQISSLEENSGNTEPETPLIDTTLGSDVVRSDMNSLFNPFPPILYVPYDMSYANRMPWSPGNGGEYSMSCGSDFMSPSSFSPGGPQPPKGAMEVIEGPLLYDEDTKEKPSFTSLANCDAAPDNSLVPVSESVSLPPISCLSQQRLKEDLLEIPSDWNDFARKEVSAAVSSCSVNSQDSDSTTSMEQSTSASNTTIASSLEEDRQTEGDSIAQEELDAHRDACSSGQAAIQIITDPTSSPTLNGKLDPNAPHLQIPVYLDIEGDANVFGHKLLTPIPPQGYPEGNCSNPHVVTEDSKLVNDECDKGCQDVKHNTIITFKSDLKEVTELR